MINLSHPNTSERVRNFQPPWRTVYIYVCTNCHNVVRVRANAFVGKNSVPSVGAILCPHCGK